MNDYFLLIFANILTVPLAYFVGYKLRKRVPKERRFFVGFAIAASLLTISFILGLAFPSFITPIQLVTTAIAIGFPLGFVLPSPSNDSTI